MTAPTTPFHPTSAAIPKDGEYAGSFNKHDIYIAGDKFIDIDCDDHSTHTPCPLTWLATRDDPYAIAVKTIIAQHRARKAKLAESPTMTRDEIIETAARAAYNRDNGCWERTNGEFRAYAMRDMEAALIAVGKIEPLKPPPVKTPGEVVADKCSHAVDHVWLASEIDAALAAQAAADAKELMKLRERCADAAVRWYAGQPVDKHVIRAVIGAVPLTAGDAK